MASTEHTSTTGMLIHGRHLQSIGWERMMWGEPETGRMGTLPTAVLNVLEEGPEKVIGLTMGTGASRLDDGTSESRAAHNLLVERFDDLPEFEAIRKHPLWEPGHGFLERLIEEAELDETSKNTKQEMAYAAILFDGLGVRRVIHVTGRDHAPRCQLVQGEARQAGIIPPSQHWLLVSDDIPYLGGIAGGTVVLEQPHRDDDETLKRWDPGLWPANFMRSFFDLPRNRRRITAMLMRDVIGRMSGMDEDALAEFNEQFKDV